MAAAGYGESARTVFLWEGVTNYLSEAAVDATLRWCSRAAPGSRLLFTYVERSVLEEPAIVLRDGEALRHPRGGGRDVDLGASSPAFSPSSWRSAAYR